MASSMKKKNRKMPTLARLLSARPSVMICFFNCGTFWKPARSLKTLRVLKMRKNEMALAFVTLAPKTNRTIDAMTMMKSNKLTGLRR